MEITKEKYDRLIADVRTLGMYKKKIKEQNNEIQRLNRVLVLRDKEIQELTLLLGNKIDFFNKVGGKL